MGSEIIAIVFIPGIYLFVRLCYLTLVAKLPDRAVFFITLLLAIALGVNGMLNSYLPSIPENYNTSFLLGWFMIKTSLWLIVLYPVAKLCIFLMEKFQNKGVQLRAK
jgi:hypothetical protein